MIFTNEDGGTATDRLMATWGRTTDIEYVYGAEVDAQGRSSRKNFRARATRSQPFEAATTDAIR